MNAQIKNQAAPENAFSAVLSREEVLSILAVLKLKPIPNLGKEPIPALTPELRAYGLIVAERSLRARGLAGLDSEGRVRFPNQLLNAVGTCALAERSIFVTQMDSPTNQARQFTVHQNGRGSTIHTSLDGAVHQFAWHVDPALAAEQIAANCGFNRTDTESAEGIGEPQLTDLSFSIDGDVLNRVAESARAGYAAQAAELLKNEGVAEAVALAEFLAAPHTTTVFQIVTPLAVELPQNLANDERPLAIQSTTFLHNKREMLIVVDEESTDEPQSQTCLVMSATAEGVHQRISMLLS